MTNPRTTHSQKSHFNICTAQALLAIGIYAVYQTVGLQRIATMFILCMLKKLQNLGYEQVIKFIDTLKVKVSSIEKIKSLQKKRN